jgi:predicted lipoprotein
VKATGTISQVDTSKSVGVMEVNLDGYPGPIKVNLYLGPRIPSDETSVRDGVGFINFGDFKEQTEYGKVAAELNKRVNQEVLSPLNKDQLVGKKISFYGIFTVRTFNLVNIDMKQINVVPIKIEIQ